MDFESVIFGWYEPAPREISPLQSSQWQVKVLSGTTPGGKRYLLSQIYTVASTIPCITSPEIGAKSTSRASSEQLFSLTLWAHDKHHPAHLRAWYAWCGCVWVFDLTTHASTIRRICRFFPSWGDDTKSIRADSFISQGWVWTNFLV